MSTPPASGSGSTLLSGILLQNPRFHAGLHRVKDR
jgi:hypothetical protein